MTSAIQIIDDGSRYFVRQIGPSGGVTRREILSDDKAAAALARKWADAAIVPIADIDIDWGSFNPSNAVHALAEEIAAN